MQRYGDTEMLVNMSEYTLAHPIIFDEAGNFVPEIVSVETAPLSNWYHLHFRSKNDRDVFASLLREVWHHLKVPI